MIDWLKVKMADFFTLPARISALRIKAEAIREIIQDRDPNGAAQLSGVVVNLGQIQNDQTAMQSRVSGLLGRLGAIGVEVPGLSGYGGVWGAYDPGLGVVPLIPLALIVTGGAVALGIVGVFANYRKQVGIVNAIERGALTAEEAQTIGAGRPLFGLGGMGKIAVPLMLIAGLAFAAPMLRRATR